MKKTLNKKFKKIKQKFKMKKNKKKFKMRKTRMKLHVNVEAVHGAWEAPTTPIAVQTAVESLQHPQN